MWLLGKEGLEVYGPKGDKIYGISDYLRSRFHDPRLPSLASKLDVRVVEVGEGSLDVKGYKLTTCWTDHNIPTLACKLRKGLRSIAYSSDVHQCKRVVELAKGVDLLVHECTFSDGQMELARKTLHSTPSLIATTVREAMPKRVVLTHFDRTSEPKVDEFASLVEDLTGIDTIAAYEGLELRI
jgi:ribonuclease BN (tRNA processing enzyme)